MTHLDKFAFDDFSEADRSLLQLMFSVVMVSFPAEVWKRPRVRGSGAAYLGLVVEPQI